MGPVSSSDCSTPRQSSSTSTTGDCSGAEELRRFRIAVRYPQAATSKEDASSCQRSTSKVSVEVKVHIGDSYSEFVEEAYRGLEKNWPDIVEEAKLNPHACFTFWDRDFDEWVALDDSSVCLLPFKGELELLLPQRAFQENSINDASLDVWRTLRLSEDVRALLGTHTLLDVYHKMKDENDGVKVGTGFVNED